MGGTSTEIWPSFGLIYLSGVLKSKNRQGSRKKGREAHSTANKVRGKRGANKVQQGRRTLKDYRRY